MREFIVSEEQAGKHIVRASVLEFPNLMPSVLQKALKHKDLRVNGKRVSSDVTVEFGDKIEIWLPDSVFDGDAKVSSKGPVKDSSSKSSKTTDSADNEPAYKVSGQTDDLLIVNKRQGIAVHSGKGVTGDTLIDIIRRDMRSNNIDLCHRIDMNTGGLILLAKNKKALEDATELFKHNLIIKRYRCLVLGVPTEGESVICEDEAIMKEVSAFLEKSGNQVFIHDIRQPADLPITSRYRVLQVYRGIGPDKTDVSDIEVELVTGRMHQIRAQFAHMGYPIIGDGNYGRNKINTHFKSLSGGKVRYQQLFSSTLMFRKIPAGNIHVKLSGRSFSIEPRYDVVLEKNGGKNVR